MSGVAAPSQRCKPLSLLGLGLRVSAALFGVELLELELADFFGKYSPNPLSFARDPGLVSACGFACGFACNLACGFACGFGFASLCCGFGFCKSDISISQAEDLPDLGPSCLESLESLESLEALDALEALDFSGCGACGCVRGESTDRFAAS
mmetsp:Transcript_69278/g.165102  ORF Transcript_69278/g.165102 Transcript_69278/m.165102 type:complete len:152 (-) Transcript_69278:327-782(-)